MKKRLFAIALALMLALTLLPVTAYADDEGSADLGTAKTHCYKCGTITTFKILEVVRSPIMEHDRVYHWVKAQCKTCGNEQTFHPDGAIGSHSGGTETPTCTTAKPAINAARNTVFWATTGARGSPRATTRPTSAPASAMAAPRSTRQTAAATATRPVSSWAHAPTAAGSTMADIASLRRGNGALIPP